MKTLDLLGKTIGKLWICVQGPSNSGTYWFCKCDCGNEVLVRGSSLVSGHTKSCGCLQKEKVTKHGGWVGSKESPEYRSWLSMKSRCLNKKSPDYLRYGERGIKICKEWKFSFKNFIQDMGKRPSLEYSLDRIDNSGNYEKSNCRWATMKQQSNNRRKRSN